MTGKLGWDGRFKGPPTKLGGGTSKGEGADWGTFTRQIEKNKGHHANAEEEQREKISVQKGSLRRVLRGGGEGGQNTQRVKTLDSRKA